MKILFSLFLVLLLMGCNPMKTLYKEIKDLGYIRYTTPLAFAGPGTLIGGRPKSLSLVASPESCFPNDIDGLPTNLIRIDETTIPQKTKRITTKGKVNFELLDFLGTGNAGLSAGLYFNKVQTVSLTMKGVHIEYLDSIALTSFYQHRMSEICKEYLDKVGFIIQAIKVDELVFKFYDKSGMGMHIDLNNIQQIVDIGASLDFSIENEASLHIKTPKYIGYQLGRLIKEDNGMVLYRSTTTRFNKFVFKSLDLFEGTRSKLSAQSLRAQEPELSEFKELESSDIIND